ncbi:MAG: peptide-methionine (R)-S-oxide reductase MsrB [Pseudomonadota bacterium]
MRLNRRDILQGVSSVAAATLIGAKTTMAKEVERLELSDEEWRKRLTSEQYRILRKEGTERAFTSELNNEKREGVYHCVGCDLPLFNSSAKYDSRTGWPSFYDVIPGHVGTKIDYKLIYPRTEYHCKRCGGHHGHVFRDGPQPTGLRYCNNGDVLIFKPKADA